MQLPRFWTDFNRFRNKLGGFSSSAPLEMYFAPNGSPARLDEIPFKVFVLIAFISDGSPAKLPSKITFNIPLKNTMEILFKITFNLRSKLPLLEPD